MAATCPYCDQSFHTSRGLFGQEATAKRDAHARCCRENPRNKCFCGRVFSDSAARDNHATRCEMNPANNFKCMYCPQEFRTTFGILAKDGRQLRDAHALCCKGNPANACHCGQVFPNEDARNAHAIKCQMNPANCFKCRFCPASYVTTFNVFGFKNRDGMACRELHEVACERNPKNSCYCGKLFPNPTARDSHAASCEENPANRFECPHCDRVFVTKYGLMGMVVSDGRRLRDAHERGCIENVANTCFCGQLFANPEARDAHAAKCSANPVNRFSCRFCRKVFVTSFGMFTSCGSIERDKHQLVCSQNPCNSTCVHCQLTFTDTEGVLGYFQPDAQRRCRAHGSTCSHNPRNRFSCQSCGRCFTSRRRWLRTHNGKEERDRHQAGCDVIPCEFEVMGTEVSEWHLVSSPDIQACGTCSGTTRASSEAGSGSGELSEVGSFDKEAGSAAEPSEAGSLDKEEQDDCSESEEEDDEELHFHDARSASGDGPELAEAVENIVQGVSKLPSAQEADESDFLQLMPLGTEEDSPEASLCKAWKQDAFEVLESTN
eukprot:TRINITY_DN44437_c0_g1_i1.p1 TRINITY_DN44437_c0_g1~~TRINITY_DN44437_c0_g1_i1.p1  ORF type:complete len:572 (+),score=100.86 TRINITY_DN44437_c0_g1_i1:74-1717(+)